MPADDTRDITIETRAELRALRNEIADFMDESRKHRECIQKKINSFDALVNKGKGAWISVIGLGGAAGWIGAHFPGINHLFK